MAKFDIKQAVVNHIEKAVFGIVMLVVLMGLAGTNWTSYRGTPDEITEKVKQGDRTLEANTWPEEEKAQYVITDSNKPSQVVYEALRRENNPGNYEFSAKFVTRPGGADEPLREPELLAPQEPIATQSRVLIAVAPKPTETESELNEDGTLALNTPEEDDDPDTLDEFRKRETLGPSGEAGYGGEMYEMQAAELSEYNSMYGGSGAEAGYSGEDEYLAGMSGESGMSLPKQEGQGYRFISVRAIFPLRDQIRKYADAINRPYHEAARSFEIIDFNLERQAKQPGDDPWSGDWEPVDINVAYDVLENAAGYEPDVINGLITNGVITMPLPMRVSGQWRNQATHPRIKNFELSEDQIRLEVEMNRKMLEKVIEERKAIRETEVPLGGFNHLVFNTGDLQSQLMGGESMYDMEPSMGGEYYGGSGSGSGYGGRGRRGTGTATGANSPTEQLIEKLMKDGENPEEQKKILREWIKSRASVEGELLLFRYFDFSVEPGETYRYRVRFVLNNPNYGKRVADAGGLASVVEGPTRVTDWSEATEPVVVEDTINYFMADVRNPRSSQLFPAARMDVYQWDADHGTTINDEFEVRLGQQLSDEVKATVIDPAQQIYEEQDYKFTAEDFLVDAIEDLEIDEEFHNGERVEPAFKLPNMPGVRDKLALTGSVIVKDIDDGLRVLDPYKDQKKHDSMKKYVSLQAKAFEYIKEAAEAVTNLEGEYGDYGELYGSGMEEYGEGMMGSGRGRSRSSLRRRGSRRGMEPGMMGSGP